MKRSLLWFAVSFLALGSVAETAPACTCDLFSPEEEFARSEAVFKGIVLSISPSGLPGEVEVVVIATGYWKGTISSIVAVYTNDTDAACGYGFEVGTEYLIYGDFTTDPCCDGVRTDLCRRTQPLAGAQLDLDYLGDPMPVPVEQVTWGMVKAMYSE